MKRIFFILFAFFLITACKKKENQELTTGWIQVSQRVKMKESGNFLELKSGNFNYKIPHSRLPFKKIVFLNASLIGYVAELGSEDKIVGVSSPEYIYSDKIHQLIDQGKIADVGNEQKYSIEKIIALKPDAVFTNYISTFGNTYDLLKKNKIEVIFLDDYLEQKPLEKAAYLKVFGKLLGMDKAAALRSGEIASDYENLKQLAFQAKEKPVVLSNEMYGAQWFLPGGKTASAEFIKDAGANYILADNQDEKAVPLSFEEVFSKSKGAKVWVNLGSHSSRNDLLAINPNYTKLDVWKTGKLYTVTGAEKNRSNDFFESGVVRADAVLKDYIKIFHPDLLPDHKLVYMKELK